MSNQELEKLADILQKSDEYRVARKYQKPKEYKVMPPFCSTRNFVI